MTDHDDSIIDYNPDTYTRQQLGEINDMWAAVDHALTQWYDNCHPPNWHGVGAFLEALALKGYNVERMDPPIDYVKVFQEEQPIRVFPPGWAQYPELPAVIESTNLRFEVGLGDDACFGTPPPDRPVRIVCGSNGHEFATYATSDEARQIALALLRAARQISLDDWLPGIYNISPDFQKAADTSTDVPDDLDC